MESVRTPSSAAMRAANASAPARAAGDGVGSSRRADPVSSSRPAIIQPMVPLRRSKTLAYPMRWRRRAPMMLRVRPAQCTTMVALGSGARSAMCRATSPLGALRPPGMVARRCSSGVRESRRTIFSPFCWRACSSSGCISRTWCTTWIFSPKSLLGTFTPHSVGWPSVVHRLMPPSSTATRRNPIRSRVAAARGARRPSSSQTITRVPADGTRRVIRYSSWRRGTRLAPGICASLYSPGSRTSMRAQVPCASSSDLRAAAVIFSGMSGLAPRLWDRGGLGKVTGARPPTRTLLSRDAVVQSLRGHGRRHRPLVRYPLRAGPLRAHAMHEEDQEHEAGVHDGEEAEIVHEGEDLGLRLGLSVQHGHRLLARRHRVGAMILEVLRPQAKARGRLRIPGVHIGHEGRLVQLGPPAQERGRNGHAGAAPDI